MLIFVQTQTRQMASMPRASGSLHGQRQKTLQACSLFLHYPQRQRRRVQVVARRWSASGGIACLRVGRASLRASAAGEGGEGEREKAVQCVRLTDVT